ncbi:metal ABC transporter permease [Palleronia sp.]|uniref:metal ABC transporter permease n=1 Tax=Palleronia sp. TaxID=1940284 RepID=UPI0035C7F366
MDDFLLRAALAGTGLILATAPLGCFVVWRRMAYFGDATGHAAVLGVAVAVTLSLPVIAGVLATTAAFGVLLFGLTRQGTSADTVLGVLSHSLLAIGLVGVALAPGPRIDLEGLLFGDILAVRSLDVWLIWIGGAAVAAIVAARWNALLTATLGDDLARAGGINPPRDTALLTGLLALTVALALKMVGALLISALLIIPAAAARPFARSPEAMVALAAALGLASVLGGLGLSFLIDSPAGPSIIVAAAALFAVARAVQPAR